METTSLAVIQETDIAGSKHLRNIFQNFKK